jgi:hypothetical protein
LLNFFYHDRILGQAGRKIGESVGSISRGRPLVRPPISIFEQYEPLTEPRLNMR